MSGICGWLGESTDAPRTIAAMAARLSRTRNGTRSANGAGFGLSVSGPARATGWFASPTLCVAFHGHPFRLDVTQTSDGDALAADIAKLHREHGAQCVQRLGGDFALAVIDAERHTLLCAVDRCGVRNLVYRRVAGTLVFGETIDAVSAFPGPQAALDRQSLYNFLYFHMVPGPRTVFEGYTRLQPATLLHRDGAARERVSTYWQLRFDEPGRQASAGEAERLRDVLRHGVHAFAPADREGAFLSGGTDSSTVCGLLSERLGRGAATYSIGFAADGYDEMDYARIAARHFATDHHEYYVTPDDVVETIPEVVEGFDQPFGNASAVPTFLCARLAKRDGVERMLAGDGGDELFGGNARYAKQAQLAHYERIPRGLRRLLELGLPRLPAVGVVRKARSYVAQAGLPMPARYETYNLLERLGPARVCTPEFLSGVDRDAPLALLAEPLQETNARSLINRLLAIDLRFTLFDSDLPKVTRMCERAGVDVAFPMLHDDVVAYSATLDAPLKLRGARLRPFFKDSLRGFLPDATIAKEKHGFGLPAGPWLASHAPLNALMRDALRSFADRGIVRADFIDELVGVRLKEHAGYYGTMLWILMMLELWLQRSART